jgi:hypothetical protein
MLFGAIKSLLRGSRMVSDEEYYCSQAVDIVDLERRMRIVERGQAPFQNGYRD